MAAPAGPGSAACGPPQSVSWYLALPQPASATARPEDRLDDFSERLYVDLLRSAEEPSLRCGEGSGDAYRFVREPSFQASIVVRAYRDAAGQAWVSARSLPLRTFPPAATPGPVWQCPAPRALSGAEWDAVVAAFAPLQLDTGEAGLDGDTWHFESRVDGRHRWFSQWSPRQPQVRLAGERMMELGGCTPPG